MHPPPSHASAGQIDAPALLSRVLPAALERRKALLANPAVQAFRAFCAGADGLDGVYLDVYPPGAALILYEGRHPAAFDPAREAGAALELLRPLGVRAIYFKPFAKDRSKLGGVLPPCATAPAPLAGEALPESFLIREHDWSLEIRLFDGLSTGLFLDQRDNRAFIADWVKARAASSGAPPAVLNTFAYTCAFSVGAAKAGALTTSVDVSGRYLDWGRRNFGHNDLDAERHRFARFDTFEFLAYARRKSLAYDLIILDPPSFAAGNKRKGIRPWSSVADYADLIREAAAVLKPKGLIFASTNTHELCVPGRLEREIMRAVPRPPRWVELPPPTVDFARERDRFAARAFAL